MSKTLISTSKALLSSEMKSTSEDRLLSLKIKGKRCPCGVSLNPYKKNVICVNCETTNEDYLNRINKDIDKECWYFDCQKNFKGKSHLRNCEGEVQTFCSWECASDDAMFYWENNRD